MNQKEVTMLKALKVLAYLALKGIDAYEGMLADMDENSAGRTQGRREIIKAVVVQMGLEEPSDAKADRLAESLLRGRAQKSGEVAALRLFNDEMDKAKTHKAKKKA
jgi:hypothetical protein